MHNYNFPPYSTGETGRVGSPKRREIGHGALAERALVPVLPTREEFPYAIRQVSEALGSNGSTSMGSVCASTLSLLNAGVPLKAPVAGIAMGLISDEVDGKTEYVALTDILGAEDAFGDMDFKVAGTKDFVTALQLDTKLDGIPSDVLAGALHQARDGPAAHPRRDGRGHRRPRRDVPVRAAGHHGEDPGRQDRRGHRPEGPDHQRDPGRDRRRDHHRGRRHDLRRRHRRPVGPGRGGPDQRASPTRRCPRSASGSSARSSRPPPFGAFVSLLPGRDGLLHICKLGDGKRVGKVEDVAQRRRQGRRSRSPTSTPAARSASCRSPRVTPRRRRRPRPRPPLHPRVSDDG